MGQTLRLQRIELDREQKRLAVATFTISADNDPFPNPQDFTVDIAVADTTDFAEIEVMAKARLHQLFLDLSEATAEWGSDPSA